MRAGLPPELARSRWRPTPAERRALRQEAEHFAKVRRAEGWFAIQLRAIARHVAKLIDPFIEGDPAALVQLTQMLNRYADILRPWAEVTANRLIAEVARRDAYAWFKSSRELGAGLRDTVANAPIGLVMRQLQEDQVHLITSLPIEAGRRVQEHAMEFATGGLRYDELVDKVRDLGATQTPNRATLIARTEVAKAHSAITQARARYIGSDQYIWRSVGDSAVRPMHRKLNGSVQRWDAPPEAEENGARHHPGEFPNCRCYASPILPDVIT